MGRHRKIIGLPNDIISERRNSPSMVKPSTMPRTAAGIGKPKRCIRHPTTPKASAWAASARLRLPA